MFEEVEECRLGPVDVLDHDDQGPFAGEVLEQRADGPEQLLLRRGLGREPDRRGDPRGENVSVAFGPEYRPDLGTCSLGTVALVDARHSPDDLADRPVRDAFAVRQAATAEDQRLGPDRRTELRHEAALAHPRGPEQGEQLAGAVGDGATEGALEPRELALPAHERCVEAPGAARGPPPDGDETIRRDALGLALRRDRRDRLHLHGVAYEAVRERAEQDLAGRRGLFQASRSVDRVAGHQGGAGRWVPGDHLAAVDPGPKADLQAAAGGELAVERGELGADLVGGPHRPQGVVLVDRGDAEDRHDGIADELLDRSAVALDDAAHRREVPRHQCPQRLWVELFAKGGRAGHVGEQDSHELTGLAGRGRRCYWRTAVRAELRARCQRAAACLTCRHSRESRCVRGRPLGTKASKVL